MFDHGQQLQSCPPCPPAARTSVFGPGWSLLTDDVWTLVVEHLDFIDKLSVQQTCRRFHQLLANPTTADTWGTLEVSGPRAEDVWLICEWVQRRLKGISRLCFVCTETIGKLQSDMLKVWHAVVASTAGICIRLRLACDFFGPASLLLPPSRTELVQRLTALAISVTSAADVAVVHSLAALRHLRMESSAAANAQLFNASAGGSIPSCQLTGLRTLLLSDMPPAAFFLPDTAARLQRLHSLSVKFWPLPEGVLPPEMLRLPALSRLELLQVPLRTMPDLRRLPGLRCLAICGHGDTGPVLDASEAGCSAELKAALRSNPFGGAMGLTQVILQGVPLVTQACAEAIERLPHLKVLGLDYLKCEEGAFWAATLQQRMRGRCRVELASEHVRVSEDDIVPVDKWPDGDW